MSWLKKYQEGGLLNPPKTYVYNGNKYTVSDKGIVTDSNNRDVTSYAQELFPDLLGGYKKEQPSSSFVNIKPTVSSLEEARQMATKYSIDKGIQVAKQEKTAQENQLQKDLYLKRSDTNALTQAGKQLTDFGTSWSTAPKRLVNTAFTALTPDVINDSPQSYTQRVYDAAKTSDEDLWKGRIGTPSDKAGMVAEGATELALTAMPMPSIRNIKMGAGMLADDFGKAGQYLTTQTPLKDAYKINPWAFKPSKEMGYRMLGKEGYKDAVQSGVLRAKPIPNKPTNGGISLARNTNRNPNTGKMQSALDRPYFADGFIDERYAADYMAAVNKADNNLVPIPTHKGIAPAQAGNVPLENATLYKKDWLLGYKEISKPKSTFKSEIDWSKWNPDTPKYPELINEYNTIEKQAKANGTWMKNPDGSVFQGTPEQFIQQQSSWFKKAFGKSIVRDEKGDIIKMYHGSINKEPLTEYITPKRLKDFKRRTQTTKETDHTFFSPKKEIADKYSKRDLLGNDKGIIYENYINVENPYFTNDYIDLATPHNLPNINSYDAVTNMKFGKDYSPKDYSELAIPFGNNVKSAIGNVGFFDMTNPNIYKALIPTAIGTGTGFKIASQSNQKQMGEWLNNY